MAPLEAINIENSILGSIILDNTLAYKLDELSKDMFSVSYNKEIFEIMKSLYKNNYTLDIPTIKTKLDELAQKGNQFEEEEQYEEAIQAWKEALSLIPEPQQFYSETIWFLAAIGDIYFQKKQYEKAHECFDKARGNLSGEGYGNPFVMLRLGECCLEIGDEKNATEYLLRAYMFEGREIFEPDEDGNDDGKKYFDYLRTHVENIE